MSIEDKELLDKLSLFEDVDGFTIDCTVKDRATAMALLRWLDAAIESIEWDHPQDTIDLTEDECDE